MQKCDAVRCVLAHNQFLHQHHLNLPRITSQYAQWVGGALRGNSAPAYDAAPRHVSHQIAQALPATMEAVESWPRSWRCCCAIPLGVYSAC